MPCLCAITTFGEDCVTALQLSVFQLVEVGAGAARAQAHHHHCQRRLPPEQLDNTGHILVEVRVQTISIPAVGLGLVITGR